MSTIAPQGEGRVSDFHLDDFLPYRLSVTMNRVSRAFARRYAAEFGLSIAEWRVLAVLGSFQPLSSNGIVEKTQMDKAKVSRAVASLLAGGLLKRRVDAADQRLLELTFTARGRRVYEAIVPRARALEAELTTGLGSRERALFLELLARLDSRVQAMEKDATGVSS
jgi:DNA-binding MarR family transcriptional regulator